MSLYNNVIQNVNKTEEVNDEDKLGYEFWNMVENAPVIKQIGNYFQQNNANIQAMNEYARSKENDELLSKGLAWTAYGLEQVVGAPFKLIDMGLDQISDRTNIDKRSLKLGLDLLIASKGVKGSKTGAFNKGVQTRQGINRQYNKFANIFKKPGDQLIDIKGTRVFDDVASLSINDAKIGQLLNPIFTATELGLDPEGTTFYSINNNDPSLLIGNIVNIGETGFRFGKGINKLTAPEFVDQRFQTYGFKKGPNGGWLLDRETYKKLPTNQQREIIQIMQTSITQTVPQSFTKDKLLKNTQLNTDLADYNAKYGARAELHHSFPSALSAEFFLDKEYMGTEWTELIRIANEEFGNYPGQPFGVDENSNLVAVPSKIGSNHPNYDAVVARYGSVPPHLHNIIHSQFFANETGMSGKKFFTEERLARMDEGFEGELEVWREWNAIIKRNREMWEEAMSQLDVFFSKGSKTENPDKLVELLEEYLATGKIKIGSGLVRDKQGNVLIEQEGTDTALSTMKTADYSQFSVNDIVSAALADFKKDANLIFDNDPRLGEVRAEINQFGLEEDELELAEELLYKIKHYNSIKLTDGASRARIVTGISAPEHKKNIKQYYDLIQLKLPIDLPDKKYYNQSIFQNIQLPNFEKQLELILEDGEQTELNLNEQ